MSRKFAPNGHPEIVPSLLAADFADLRKDLNPLLRAGVKWASVDVMDGHFVPNLSFGPDVVSALRKGPKVFLDAHLMVEDPEKFGPIFAKAGADLVTFHLEACKKPRALIKKLKKLGVGVGLAIKPKTPAKELIKYLDLIDLALVMTVEPGFGGQGFIKKMLPKVRDIRSAIDKKGLKVWLQVDGGINKESVTAAASAGADSLVAGSAVFKARRPVTALRTLEGLAKKAFKRSK
jgi:ribulose-phosphate 3-epimerase